MIEEIHLQAVGSFKKDEGKLWSMSWSPDGNTLISTNSERVVRIWRLKSDNSLTPDDVIEHEHTKTVRAVSFSANGRLLALASFDTKISIWQLEGDSFEYVTTLEGHESEVKFVDWHPTKELLVSSSRDKTAWIWEYDEDMEFQCYEVLSGHAQDVKMVKWVPNTDFQIVSASYDDTIKLWDNLDDEYTCLQTITEHSSTVWSIAFSSTGQELLTSSEDMTVKVFVKNAAGDKFVFALNISGYHERTIYSVDFFSETNIIASAGGDDTICMYQLKPASTSDDSMTFQLLEKKIEAHNSDINCIHFHPHQRLLASCGDDGDIKLWKF